MTDLSLPAPRRVPVAWVYAVGVFLSAALVFSVQPMVGRMVLPLLGGSPAVWNASMVFFQAALLIGYAYAHALQQVRSVRVQALIHLGALALGAAFLPLQISGLLGAPSVDAPAFWLLGVLALSVGVPFAVLSATAPLLQAWYLHARSERDRPDPYVLYAASNLGSLLALLAYPLALEPALALADQTRTWAVGYALFAALALALTLGLRRAGPVAAQAQVERSPAPRWRERLIWIGLAAIPSSLMLGVTSHISTDVASAPFLWVLPLGLYLLTFIIAFQARPLGVERVRFWQAGVAAALLAAMLGRGSDWPFVLVMSLTAFFLTALACHQRLAERRPAPDRLTDFYLCLSVGGVLGGAFTALAAPYLFDFVWEYPAALVLAGLVQPWGRGRLRRWEAVLLALAVMALAAGALLMLAAGRNEAPMVAPKAMFGVAAFLIFLLRGRALIFTLLLAGLALSNNVWAGSSRILHADRGFYGVLRVGVRPAGEYGDLHVLYHGTTVHGAQATAPAHRCEPLTYYAAGTPVQQALLLVQQRKPAARIGVAGLGTGSMAAYTRPGDRLRFFEIDPLMVSLARDRRYFSFLDCARGPVDITLGDARLTLAREPAGGLDYLLVDAFSSDAVPTHLLTAEALELYLDKLAPDGLLVLHLSNRHLALARPTSAALRRSGTPFRLQNFRPPAGSGQLVSSSQVLVASRSPEAIAALAADKRWIELKDEGDRPWTDDYVNLIGTLMH